MNPCKLKEPKVINSELLRRCVLQEFPEGESRRLAEEEGVPLVEVTRIRLEFQYILRIDHLWALPSLTKLSLNNNLIEKIENLECLINLVELDLSFNKITKIENLEKLVNLEKLALFKNYITKLENMDTLKKLIVFSIGCNQIDDLENILYLRQFHHLKSLNLAQNPCTNDPNFRLFLAAFLPQLTYHEYRRLPDLEKEVGRAMYLSRLRSIEDKEEELRSIQEREEIERYNNELYTKSFVEYLNTSQLFDSLFMNDEDGQALLHLGDEARDLYQEYQTQFNDLCKQIFDNGQKQYLIRNEEVERFLKSLNDIKVENQNKSIHQIEKFSKEKQLLLSKISNKLESENDYRNLDEITNQFDAQIHKIWKVLMKLELELVEQIEQIQQNFEHGLTEMVNQFIEASQAIISQIRSLEMAFNENITTVAEQFLASINLDETIAIPPELENIMIDKEALLNALANSNYMHIQLIDNREDTLVSRAKDWCRDLVKKLEKDEIRRNRNKILEINHFLDTQRQEFDKVLENF